MTCGVYIIENKVNGKIYIGSSLDIEKRWRSHLQQKKFLIGRAFEKYGTDSFDFRIVEECEPEELIDREQHYLDDMLPFAPVGYNICETAGNTTGITWTQERREQQHKIRKARGFGKWNKGRPSWNKGQRWSKNTKDKISEGRMGLCSGSDNHRSIAAEFISPDDELVSCESVNSLCREYGLHVGAMCLVLRGNRNHHKGWRRANG